MRTFRVQLVLLTVLMLALTACGKDEPAQPQSKGPPTEVTVADITFSGPCNLIAHREEGGESMIVCDAHRLRVVDGRLHFGDASYGPLAKGDRVELTADLKILINGAESTPDGAGAGIH